MTASRIYKVAIRLLGNKETTHYVRANSRAQAERFATSKYVTSCVASQDDMIKACEPNSGFGIEDARKEAPVDEGTNKE